MQAFNLHAYSTWQPMWCVYAATMDYSVYAATMDYRVTAAAAVAAVCWFVPAKKTRTLDRACMVFLIRFAQVKSRPVHQFVALIPGCRLL